MERRFNLINLGWLTLLVLLILLSRVVPISHEVSSNLEAAHRAAEHDLPAQAAQHLGTAAERQPWRTDLWELAGHYAIIANNPVLAIEYLEDGKENTSEGLSLHGLLDLGDAYYEIEERNAAVNSWERAHQQYGPSYETVDRLMQIYQEAGDYHTGISMLEELVELYPDDANLHFELALLYASLGEVKDSQEALKRAAELDTNLIDAVESLQDNILLAQRQSDPAYPPLLICQGLAEIHKWRLAALACEKSLQLYPNYAEAWAYLGLAHNQMSKEEYPITDSDGFPELQKALELDPNSLAANSLLAFYWIDKGEYDLALETMQEAIQLAPDRADLRVDLGALLALSGDLQNAYQAYQKAVELSPSRTAYLRHLVNFSLKYDYQVEQVALPSARKAINIDSEEPANLDLMAKVMIHLGDLNSAERFAHRALEIDQDYAPAHLRLGFIYLFRGEELAAYQALTKAAALSPGTPVADQAMRLISTYFP